MAEETRPAVNKWLITAAVMIGTFLSVMDVSIVNVALPHMMGSFGQTMSTITWVATSYTIAAMIVITMTGWLSELMGRKTLYMLSFVVFTVATVLCGTAHTFTEMILWRVLQGFGSGGLVPISQAIIRETFPPKEQGIGMAVFGMGVVLAPAIGPVLGGWLIDHFGWPWIFYVNIPFSIVGLWMVNLYIHDPVYLKRGVKKVDWIGIVLLSFALTGMQIVLERGNDNGWFESSFILWWTAATLIAAVVFIFWELHIEEPIVELRILKDPIFTLGSVIVMLYSISLYGSSFILPQFTQTMLHYSAYQAGMTLLPRAVILFFLMPVVGKLYNRFGARALVFVGIAFTCYAYWLLAGLALTAAFETMIPMLLAMGVGMAFFYVPLTAATLSNIPNKDATKATSINTLLNRIGGNLGYALVVTLLQQRLELHRIRLGEHISHAHTQAMSTFFGLKGFLAAHGFGPGADTVGAAKMLAGMVKRQALMLAYNDVSWLFLMMFLFVIVLVLFLPGKPKHPVSAEHAVVGE